MCLARYRALWNFRIRLTHRQKYLSRHDRILSANGFYVRLTFGREPRKSPSCGETTPGRGEYLDSTSHRDISIPRAHKAPLRMMRKWQIVWQIINRRRHSMGFRGSTTARSRVAFSRNAVLNIPRVLHGSRRLNSMSIWMEYFLRNNENVIPARSSGMYRTIRSTFGKGVHSGI